MEAAVVHDALPQQRDFADAVARERADLRQNLAGGAAVLGAAHIRDDAVRAAPVAAEQNGHQGREAGFRAVLHRDFPSLSLLPPIETGESSDRTRAAMTQLLRGNPHRSFAINFRCKPFWYLGGVAPITLLSSHNYIANPGNVFSEPVLQITRNGNAAFTVGGTYFELMDLFGTVTVDTPRMETFMNYTSYNSRVWGEYPRLLPGNNLVSWSGSVSRIVITPNWRMI